MKTYLGIDTGGTFTDMVLVRAGKIATHKILSTPHAPEQAIIQGVQEMGLFKLDTDEELYIVHGSTVATNAVLEGKGVRTVYITNSGMRDMLTIGRQARNELYNLQPRIVCPPVPREYCLEVNCRLAADGSVVEPLDVDEVSRVVQHIKKLKPAAIAVNLLFSYLNDTDEKTLANYLPEEMFVSLSSNVLPEIKEYERGITTWLNAYVGPLVKGYIQRLQRELSRAQLYVMQSAGTTVHAEQAGDAAVRMLLSGPAGGLAAAFYIKELINQSGLLTFDMGGTSTDVALVQQTLSLTNEAHVAGYPVAVPMLDIHTIGAGGGSIASIDAGGLLKVGPESAGADPGPACYGKGGNFATVTDANLVLGRLLPDAFLGGEMNLDILAATGKIESLAQQLNLTIQEAARGIVQLANDHMVQALRVMTVQRGVDPRTLTLMCFGGAGGLHVCALADSLEMQRAIVPVFAGVLSAFGMLIADKGRHLSHTLVRILNKDAVSYIKATAQALMNEGKTSLIEEGTDATAISSLISLDCRYQGQSYTLNVNWSSLDATHAEFHQLHETRYGHRLALPIEVVNVRVAVTAGAAPIKLPRLTNTRIAQPSRWINMADQSQQVPVYARDSLAHRQVVTGPALISESVSTTYIAPDWQAEVDAYGNLLLTRNG